MTREKQKEREKKFILALDFRWFSLWWFGHLHLDRQVIMTMGAYGRGSSSPFFQTGNRE